MITELCEPQKGKLKNYPISQNNRLLLLWLVLLDSYLLKIQINIHPKSKHSYRVLVCSLSKRSLTR